MEWNVFREPPIAHHREALKKIDIVLLGRGSDERKPPAAAALRQ